ncbi:MAG: methionine gamma-lyase family protein [Vulcanimicrobiota bacterium]
MLWQQTLQRLGIGARWVELAEEGERATAARREEIRRQGTVRGWRVLEALQAAGLGEGHFANTTGYGYGDGGRELLDEVTAAILGTEAACLRLQIVSGTHAIAAGLFGNLNPGDELVSLTGPPYDTLMPVIGPGACSLAEMGVSYRQLELDGNGRIDFDKIQDFLRPTTRMVFLQRSRGYTWRPSHSVAELEKAMTLARRACPEALMMVDNCYGELVEPDEPSADLLAGSLIKNLGGGVVPTGGYIAGRRAAVERAANRVTAPGIGGEQGPTLGFARNLAQGLFLAPGVVAAALEGAVWAAWMFEQAGLEASPGWKEPRTDLIQAVRLGSPEAQKAFCRGVQRAGPVDHKATPQPVVNPGYRDPILMAGGTFIQGSSIELSADGPLREPYACYLQGGLNFGHVQLGALRALSELETAGFLPREGR